MRIVLALIGLAAIVAGCVVSGETPAPSESPGAPTTSPVSPMSPAPSPATPDVSPAPNGDPSPVASPSPTPRPGVADLAWHRTGTIPASSYVIDSVVGFAQGYVAVDGASQRVWFSTDGRDWQAIELADGRPRSVATDGTQVVVVGGYGHPPCRNDQPGDTGGGPECPLAPISWVSDDGVTWRSGYPGPRPIDPPGFSQGSEFVAVWAVPDGGWDAALSHWEGESLSGRGVWHSSDGLTWSELGPAPTASQDVSTDEFPWVHAGIADAAGRRLLWEGWSDHAAPLPSGEGTSVTTLATSADGRSWAPVDDFAGRSAQIWAGVPPGTGHPSWVLVGASDIADDYSSLPTVWVSSDAARWEEVILPSARRTRAGGVTSITAVPSGYVAVRAQAPADGPVDHWTWLSDDGRSWVELPQVGTPGADFGPWLVADGPAGVIGIGFSPDDMTEKTAVWELR